MAFVDEVYHVHSIHLDPDPIHLAKAEQGQHSTIPWVNPSSFPQRMTPAVFHRPEAASWSSLSSLQGAHEMLSCVTSRFFLAQNDFKMRYAGARLSFPSSFFLTATVIGLLILSHETYNPFEHITGTRAPV